MLRSAWAWMIVVFWTAEAQQLRTAMDYFEAGENAFYASRYEEAVDRFSQCLVIDAGFYSAYTSRAAAKEELNDWAGAITDYSIFLEEFPHHSETLFRRGLARLHGGQFSASAHDFKMLLRLNNHGETNSIFYRQTSEGIDQIISTQSNIKDQLYNYIGQAEHQLENYDAAIHYFDSAIQINPRASDYFMHRALSKEKKNNLDGAKEDYQKAISIDENNSIARQNLAALLNEEDNATAAEEQLNEAILRNPHLPYPYLERAFYRLEMGNLNGALEDYDQAISLNPNDVDSWVNRGLVKEKLKDLVGAHNDFSQALQLKNDYGKAWFCRATVLTKLDKLKEADDDFTLAIFFNPDSREAYFNRAIVRYRQGRLDEACSDINKAEALQAKNTEKLKAQVCK